MNAIENVALAAEYAIVRPSGANRADSTVPRRNVSC